MQDEYKTQHLLFWACVIAIIRRSYSSISLKFN